MVALTVSMSLTSQERFVYKWLLRACEKRRQTEQTARAAEPWLSGCQVLSGDLSGCRALSGTVRCLCQTSCQVLSVLSGAVGCVSDRRGDL